KVVYLMVEADTNANAQGGAGKAAQTRPSGLYRSADGGATWTKMNGNDVRPFYYSQVRADPKDPNRVYWSSTPVNFSNDGGKTVGNATQGIHVDHHAMWIDPNDPSHFIVGDDGGVSQTWDRGGNFVFLNVITLAQPYIVSYDMAFPYHVCAGLQDNGSWCGPSRHRNGTIDNSDWITVGGGDGFYTAQELDHAVLHLGAQPDDVLRRQQQGDEVHQPRGESLSDFAGPDHAGHDEDPRQHADDGRDHPRRNRRGDVLHHRVARRVAAAAGAAVRRHRRRQRLAHAQRRRHVGELDRPLPGRPRRHVRKPYRALALRHGHALHYARQPPQTQRLHPVRVRDDRL